MPAFSSLQIRFLKALFLILSSVLSGYSQASCPADFSVCFNDVAFALSGGVPAGGTYSGSGVSGGNFIPNSANIGANTISYTYKDENNLITVCTFKITVKRNDWVFCTLEGANFCLGQAPQKISDCRYINGYNLVYTGPGFTDNTFYPIVAGVGRHEYKVTTMGSNGCMAEQTSYVYVSEGNPPIITCPDNITVPGTSSPAFEITGGSANTYTVTNFYGPGLVGDGRTFSPSIAGNGIHNFTFAAYWENAYFNDLCFSQCDFKISVGSLPVTLTKFSAGSSEANINLQWETSLETNFDHFEIERSLKLKEGFTKIHEMTGNISGQYTFTDKTAEKGIAWYYRLKMIDNDGSFAYSKIAWALIENAERLKVYPNPATTQINIESPIELVGFKLFNTSGSEVLTKKLEKIKHKKIMLQTLPGGTYLLQVKNINGTVVSSRILIQ